MDTCGESPEGKRFDTSLTAGGDGVESAISTERTNKKVGCNHSFQWCKAQLVKKKFAKTNLTEIFILVLLLSVSF